MRLVVIGGHSRDVGKTSVAAALIAATRELRWTALKITQFGHGVCSASGSGCHCAIEDPDHPYAITRELDPDSEHDTARLLQAGADEVYWVRTRVGQLGDALPALEELLAGRRFVLLESNSILRFWTPELYLPVLRFDVEDFKVSSRLYLNRSDAVVVSRSTAKGPAWSGIDPAILDERPVFPVEPPDYMTAELASFVRNRLDEPASPGGVRAHSSATGHAAMVPRASGAVDRFR